MSSLRVRESGDFGRYHVQSESDPETFYLVQLFELGDRCSCPNHRFRQAHCKHIKAAESVYRTKWADAGMKAGERYSRAKDAQQVTKLIGELWKHLFGQKQLTKKQD